jgi:hypothetical protein
MVELINAYYSEIELNGHSHKTERIMSRLFIDYIDRIINGVIFSSTFRLYTLGDPEELVQVARMNVFKSIQKKQWTSERGSIFNFFTTVIKKNLVWFTLAQNKKKNRFSEVEIENVSHENLIHHDNLDKDMTIEIIFNEMKKFFVGRERMLKLCEIFIDYYRINQGKKFVKKNFIEYAGTYTYSPSFCHSFFSNLKKIKIIQKILIDSLRD